MTFNARPLPTYWRVRGSPTLRAELLTFNTNGWVHAYRFAAPATIAFTATAGSSAFSPLAIPSGDIVRISGTSDPNQRLFKVRVGFSASQTEWAYVEHFAGCSAPDAVGDLYTPQPSYDFPVRAAQACSFSGRLSIRVPLPSNAGSQTSAPANFSNPSRNDVFTLLTPRQSLTPLANTTQNLTVPNLTGDLVRTFTVQTGAGAALQGCTVTVETASLTTFPTYGGAASAITDSTGQAQLSILAGTYQVRVTAP
ncbi:MAG: carboxypeptidase regulatory-like domain-containing protein [Archangiaceae bacterium]|nr:carboxypeptidase regulatory-like domain-containing protein [Archangiaceae bacterium]